jgi:CheY-like chemotaxis protein
MQGKQKLILLADDDIEDLELLGETILQLEPGTNLITVSNGSGVLNYLKKSADHEIPCLIVVDYNMPDMTGAEVLEQISKESRYKKIPKIVWSTSNSHGFMKECMENGASAYFVKPSTNQQLHEQAKEMLGMC